MPHVTTPPLMVPTVHRNGTARESLIEGYLDMIEVIRIAARVLAENGPNGRDYYPQGADAFKKADDQHTDRLASLSSILGELQHIAEAI